MMMTRLASVAKKPKSSELLAIPSRAFSHWKECPNSNWGLGMSEIKEIKDLVTKFNQDLNLITNRDKKGKATADCEITHTIVQDLIYTLSDYHSLAKNQVAQVEAKLLSNSLKRDPFFHCVSWKELFKDH